MKTFVNLFNFPIAKTSTKYLISQKMEFVNLFNTVPKCYKFRKLATQALTHVAQYAVEASVEQGELDVGVADVLIWGETVSKNFFRDLSHGKFTDIFIIQALLTLIDSMSRL